MHDGGFESTESRSARRPYRLVHFEGTRALPAWHAELSFEEKFIVYTVKNPQTGIDLIATKAIDVAVVDDRDPGRGGLSLLSRIKGTDARTEVILLCDSRSGPLFRAALCRGAYFCFDGMPDMDELFRTAFRACRERDNEQRVGTTVGAILREHFPGDRAEPGQKRLQSMTGGEPR